MRCFCNLSLRLLIFHSSIGVTFVAIRGDCKLVFLSSTFQKSNIGGKSPFDGHFFEGRGSGRMDLSPKSIVSFGIWECVQQHVLEYNKGIISVEERNGRPFRSCEGQFSKFFFMARFESPSARAEDVSNQNSQITLQYAFATTP